MQGPPPPIYLVGPAVTPSPPHCLTLLGLDNSRRDTLLMLGHQGQRHSSHLSTEQRAKELLKSQLGAEPKLPAHPIPWPQTGSTGPLHGPGLGQPVQSQDVNPGLSS